MTLRLSADQARRLVLTLQGLADRPRRLAADGVVDLVERLGFVQLDSISTVARAHHMILLARNQTYRPKLLRRPLEEARLFEHWTDRIAAIIPTPFYPNWNRRFRREQARLEQSFGRWFGEGFKEEVGQVLAHVRAHGPVMARDFADEAPARQRGWWDWHAQKTALEYLWRTGRLAVARREGFQKVYDLAERVIPDAVRTVEPDHEAFVDWACRSALDRLGVASPGEIARFWGLVTPGEAKAWCQGQGSAMPVIVESANGTPPRNLLARPDLEALLPSLPEPPGRLRVLNPFDPLLRDRQRLERLFAFDYRIEVFVPAARRTYGYYVFPLLEGGRLIGRIDMKARDRALDVTALWMEPGRRLTKGRHRRLEAALDRIRRFIGADAVRFAAGYLKRGG